MVLNRGRILLMVCVVLSLMPYLHLPLLHPVTQNHVFQNHTSSPLIKRKKVCVVTSAFSTDEYLLDDVFDVTYYSNEQLEFLLFSNLNVDYSGKGWKTINYFDMEVRRMITLSRWPKFLAWKHPTIAQNCEAVFYLDGSARPNPKLVSDMTEVLLELHDEVMNSKIGFVMPRHPKGRNVIEELSAISEQGKDTAENVQATVKFFNSQKDFSANIKVYQLTFFMYSTTSEHWRNLTELFWTHYYREVLSWRDQPLFAYILHHLGYEMPGSLSPKLFYPVRSGFNGHVYGSGSEIRPLNHRPSVAGTGNVDD